MAPLISATKVSRLFGSTPLFEDISLAVEEGERLAIIGRNGCGKSTFLKMLCRIETPDSGTVSWRKHLRVSYVAQEDHFPAEATIYEVLSHALEGDLSSRERRIGEALGRAGFRDKSVAVSGLSGGERKRLAITRGLLNEPEVLLLDEPTNHLDLAGIEWLEQVVGNAAFATVFVSHDRYFIQNQAHRVVEIDSRYPGSYFSVKGAYSDFIGTRETFLEQLEQYRSSLANRVRREVEWLRQGAKARTTKQKARSDQARELVAELQGITRIDQKVDIEFSASNRQTRELVKVEQLGKSMNGKVLFNEISLILSPGSRLGVVGLNGSGKTSFLKILLGDLKPDHGRVVRASKLRTALLDQFRSALDKEVTLQELLCSEGDSVVFNGAEVHVAGWARRFLFRPEQLSVPIKRLSGGERARALIARIMVEPADLLILDEPTNDLDIATLEVLEDALIEFPGAVVLVSHDRYLLERVCQVVLGLAGEKSALFADYRQWEKVLEEMPAEREEKGGAADTRKRVPAKKLGYLEQREFDQMESAILKCEKRVKGLEQEISETDPAVEAEEFQKLCEEFATQQKELERLYERWAELDEKRQKLSTAD